MSRKLILSLALGTLVATALLSGSANAMGGHGGNGHNIPNSHPHPHPYPHPHPHPNWHPNWHPQVHFRPVYERGYVRTVGVAAPVAEGLCTCLTKGYTPDGLVVFKDLCTKEMASAPVNGAPGRRAKTRARRILPARPTKTIWPPTRRTRRQRSRRTDRLGRWKS
jgi:hypothetical protein